MTERERPILVGGGDVIRQEGCRDCERSTSGDCGMHVRGTVYTVEERAVALAEQLRQAIRERDAARHDADAYEHALTGARELLASAGCRCETADPAQDDPLVGGHVAVCPAGPMAREALARRVATHSSRLSGALPDYDELIRERDAARAERDARRHSLAQEIQGALKSRGRKWAPDHASDLICAVGLALDDLAAERDEARAQAAAAEAARVKELVEDLARTIAERDEARRERGVAVAGTEDVWRWQGDGLDDPASLSCPVVMSADTLRGLLAKSAGEAARADRLAAALRRWQRMRARLLNPIREQVSRLPDEAKGPIAESCRTSDGPCWCGMHISEVMGDADEACPGWRKETP